MVIKLYISGISGNKEVKKKQQRVQMILDSKQITYEAIDITEPGKEKDKEFMQQNGKVRECLGKYPLPPQIFNDDDFCGDYEDFDLANEVDELEKFLHIATSPKILENESKVNGKEEELVESTREENANVYGNDEVEGKKHNEVNGIADDITSASGNESEIDPKTSNEDSSIPVKEEQEERKVENGQKESSQEKAEGEKISSPIEGEKDTEVNDEDIQEEEKDEENEVSKESEEGRDGEPETESRDDKVENENFTVPSQKDIDSEKVENENGDKKGENKGEKKEKEEESEGEDNEKEKESEGEDNEKEKESEGEDNEKEEENEEGDNANEEENEEGDNEKEESEGEGSKKGTEKKDDKGESEEESDDI